MITCSATLECNELILTSNLHTLDHYKLILVPTDLVRKCLIRKIKNISTPKQKFGESYEMACLVKVRYKIEMALMIQTIVKICLA